MFYINKRSTDPFSPNYSSSSPPRAAVLTSIGNAMPMNTYPPGLGYGAWRTALASLTYSNGSQHAGGSEVRLPKRPIARPPTTGRRSAPLPPNSTPEDPFADRNSQLAFLSQPNMTVVYDSHPTRPRRGSMYYPQNTSQNIPPSAQAPPDKITRSKLVAGILLNRVHAVGRPMRRRPGESQPREYVRSGLSTMVSLEEI
jgi:hypothetical protein